MLVPSSQSMILFADRSQRHGGIDGAEVAESRIRLRLRNDKKAK